LKRFPNAFHRLFICILLFLIVIIPSGFHSVVLIYASTSHTRSNIRSEKTIHASKWDYAQEIPVNITVKCEGIPFDKEKIYKFPAKTGQKITIDKKEYISIDSKQYSIGFYSPTFDYIDSELIYESTGKSRQTFTFTAIRSGYYYIKVTSFSFIAPSFGLTVTVEGKSYGGGNSLGIICNNDEAYTYACLYLAELFNASILNPPYNYNKIIQYPTIAIFCRGSSGSFKNEFGSEAIRAIIDTVENGGGLLVEETQDEEPVTNLLRHFSLINSIYHKHVGISPYDVFFRKSILFDNIKTICAEGTGKHESTGEHVYDVAYKFGDAFISVYDHVGKIIYVSGYLYAVYKPSYSSEPEINFLDLYDNKQLLNNFIQFLSSEDHLVLAKEPEITDYMLVEVWNKQLGEIRGIKTENDDLVAIHDTCVVRISGINAELIWNYTLNQAPSNFFYVRGKIVLSDDDWLYVIDETTGKLIWEKSIEQSSGQIFSNDKIIAVTDVYTYGKLFTFNMSNGDVLWTFGSPSEELYGLTGDEERVYFSYGSWGWGHVYCMEGETGVELWKVSIDDPESSLLIEDDNIFLGHSSGIYCFSKQGNIEWKFHTYPVLSHIIFQNSLFIVTYNVKEKYGFVFCLNLSNRQVSWFKKIMYDKDFGFFEEERGGNYLLPIIELQNGVFIAFHNGTFLLTNADHGVYGRGNADFYMYNVVSINDWVVITKENGRMHALEITETRPHYQPPTPTPTPTPTPSPTPAGEVSPDAKVHAEIVIEAWWQQYWYVFPAIFAIALLSGVYLMRRRKKKPSTREQLQQLQAMYDRGEISRETYLKLKSELEKEPQN